MTYKTRTDETWAIMIFVFIIQFLNTGPLLLMINSDFSEFLERSYDNKVDAGYYSDFTIRWYKDVGGIIISTMCLTIIWPVIEFLIGISMRSIKRYIWD